jgi:hypothetical protein
MVPSASGNARMSKVVNVAPSSPEYCSSTSSICWCAASEWQIWTHWMATGASKTYVTKVPPGALAAALSLPAHCVPPTSQQPGSVSQTPSFRMEQESGLSQASP